MMAACLILASSVVGQFPYYPGYGFGFGSGYGMGYGGGYGYGMYNQMPLQLWDPTRYARYYSGSGFYSYEPPAIANPEILVPKQAAEQLASSNSDSSAVSGETGLVLAVNEQNKTITLQLPTGTKYVSYGPNTHFLAADGNFPVIKPGNLISVDQNTITILKREQK